MELMMDLENEAVFLLASHGYQHVLEQHHQPLVIGLQQQVFRIRDHRQNQSYYLEILAHDLNKIIIKYENIASIKVLQSSNYLNLSKTNTNPYKYLLKIINFKSKGTKFN